VFAELLVFIRQQGKPAKCVTGYENNQKRREDALDAAAVELKKAEGVSL
jgi:hypothetical protein